MIDAKEAKKIVNSFNESFLKGKKFLNFIEELNEMISSFSKSGYKNINLYEVEGYKSFTGPEQELVIEYLRNKKYAVYNDKISW